MPSSRPIRLACGRSAGRGRSWRPQSRRVGASGRCSCKAHLTGYDHATMAQGHSVDEYLETIYYLAFPIGEYRPLGSGEPTLASRVAEMLGVPRASAGEMLKRLEREGLIERGEHKEALLTAPGRKRAERVARQSWMIERLLTDFMGCTVAEAPVHAYTLGDTFSHYTVAWLDERLWHPDRCPHGL